MPLFSLPKPMSSKKVRFEESDLASYLLSLTKRGLNSNQANVEICIMQGGAVRGNMDHPEGDFELGKLFDEFAFGLRLPLCASTRPARARAVGCQALRNLEPSGSCPTPQIVSSRW